MQAVLSLAVCTCNLVHLFKATILCLFCHNFRLLNGLKPGSVKRINKLPGAIAGLVCISSLP